MPSRFRKASRVLFWDTPGTRFWENLPWNGISECSWNAFSENSSRTQFWITILERSWNTLFGGNVAVERNFGTRGKVAWNALFGGKLPWKAVLERSWNLLFWEESCILERSWNALLAGAGVSTKLHSNWILRHYCSFPKLRSKASSEKKCVRAGSYTYKKAARPKTVSPNKFSTKNVFQLRSR